MEGLARLMLRAIVGLMLGLGLATALSLIAVGIYLARGQAPFAANETTLLEAVGGYFVGGPGAGAVAGALYPMARTAWGAAVVGAFASVPLYGAVIFAMDGWAGLSDYMTIGLCALLVGAPVGVVYRRLSRAPVDPGD